MINYKRINDAVFIGGDDAPYELFLNEYAAMANYIATREEILRTFIILKHPQDLSAVEKDRILSYCIGDDYKKGKVNYNDIFLQGEFIQELNSTGNRL